jgi:hypothetical protein
MKVIFTVAALTLGAIAPAYAADVTTCDDASVAMVADAIKNAGTAGKDAGKVNDATMMLDKAKEAMKAGKKEDCVTALNTSMMGIQ